MRPVVRDNGATCLDLWVRAAPSADKGASPRASSRRATMESSRSLKRTSRGMAARRCDLVLSTVPMAAGDNPPAVVEDDHETIRVAAHALKSACARIGAEELVRLPAMIEGQAMARSRAACRRERNRPDRLAEQQRARSPDDEQPPTGPTNSAEGMVEEVGLEPTKAVADGFTDRSLCRSGALLQTHVRPAPAHPASSVIH